MTAGEYSSLQPQRARSATLEAFRRGGVDMLVSSDAMTRGMDVENVENVISYDAPVYAKVRRCWRLTIWVAIGLCGRKQFLWLPSTSVLALRSHRLARMLLEASGCGQFYVGVGASSLLNHVPIY